ncbi:hypothetical protein GF373_16425 [bacterium]|nr:hypothetical protein [bacterium]
MGLVIPNNHPMQYVKLPNEHQVKIGINQEEWITCYILGKWRQNQRFPYCPSAADWVKQLKQ